MNDKFDLKMSIFEGFLNFFPHRGKGNYQTWKGHDALACLLNVWCDLSK